MRWQRKRYRSGSLYYESVEAPGWRIIEDERAGWKAVESSRQYLLARTLAEAKAAVERNVQRGEALNRRIAVSKATVGERG